MLCRLAALSAEWSRCLNQQYGSSTEGILQDHLNTRIIIFCRVTYITQVGMYTFSNFLVFLPHCLSSATKDIGVRTPQSACAHSSWPRARLVGLSVRRTFNLSGSFIYHALLMSLPLCLLSLLFASPTVWYTPPLSAILC